MKLFKEIFYSGWHDSFLFFTKALSVFLLVVLGINNLIMLVVGLGLLKAAKYAILKLNILGSCKSEEYKGGCKYTHRNNEQDYKEFFYGGREAVGLALFALLTLNIGNFSPSVNVDAALKNIHAEQVKLAQQGYSVELSHDLIQSVLQKEAQIKDLYENTESFYGLMSFQNALDLHSLESKLKGGIKLIEEPIKNSYQEISRSSGDKSVYTGYSQVIDRYSLFKAQTFLSAMILLLTVPLVLGVFTTRKSEFLKYVNE